MMFVAGRLFRAALAAAVIAAGRKDQKSGKDQKGKRCSHLFVFRQQNENGARLRTDPGATHLGAPNCDLLSSQAQTKNALRFNEGRSCNKFSKNLG
jgi:hypothetical protein